MVIEFKNVPVVWLGGKNIIMHSRNNHKFDLES